MAKIKHRYVFGKQPIMEAISAGENIHKILVSNRLKDESFIERLNWQSSALKIPVQKVPIEKLNRMLGKDHNGNHFNHQGVLAIKTSIKYYDLQDLISLHYEKGLTPSYLLFEGVTDVRNFGAIARSAYCFGIHALIVPSSNIAEISADAVKSSAGALEKMMLCRTKDVNEAIQILKLNGFNLLGSSLKASRTIAETDLTNAHCVLLGAEGKGISKQSEKNCSQMFKIPMSSQFDSLNVSVAAGIICYELFRAKE